MRRNVTPGCDKSLSLGIGPQVRVRQRHRGKLTAAENLHFTLTLDSDVALLGMSFPNEQDAARPFRTLTPDRMADIRDRAKQARR